MKINEKTIELRSKLFNLIREFGDLQFAVQGSRAVEIDTKLDAISQLDAARGGLASVYESLGDLFIDAARDVKDQAFSAEA